MGLLDRFKQAEIKQIQTLEKTSQELLQITSELKEENVKMNSFLAYTGFNLQSFTGENTPDELGIPQEQYIEYSYLRTRSWQYILKNHIANLMINKRVNWQIGTGLLFNAKPSEKPFIDYYGEKLGKKKHRQFIRDCEYQYRNFINTTKVDYSNNLNLHELARLTDYNAAGDGDVFILMRVENGFPNVQIISGQCVIDPNLEEEIPEGHTLNEGVEIDKTGKIVAYHVLENTNTSLTATKELEANDILYKTRRIEVYFPGTEIKQCWFYKASDLVRLNESRGMPLLSSVFETLKHLNDYLIANAKNAQLLAQMVFMLEKDASSTGERVFGNMDIDVAGMSTVTETTEVASDTEVAACANRLKVQLNGNGIVGDLPKGVKAKILNPQGQSDQAEYLKSTMQTLSSAINGMPYEVLISSYNSNYTASMGARSDFQHMLNVMVEVITASQLYRPHYNMFLYLQIFKGAIDCPPLKKAYEQNDTITIQAITNSVFEGTKLKPIDPVKFIKSLREQLPENIRQLIPFNSIDNLVNQASQRDYETISSQVSNEIDQIPDEFKKQIIEAVDVINKNDSFVNDINIKLESFFEEIKEKINIDE